jgi:hypothetical protein
MAEPALVAVVAFAMHEIVAHHRCPQLLDLLWERTPCLAISMGIIHDARGRNDVLGQWMSVPFCAHAWTSFVQPPCWQAPSLLPVPCQHRLKALAAAVVPSSSTVHGWALCHEQLVLLQIPLPMPGSHTRVALLQ